MGWKIRGEGGRRRFDRVESRLTVDVVVPMCGCSREYRFHAFRRCHLHHIPRGRSQWHRQAKIATQCPSFFFNFFLFLSRHSEIERQHNANWRINRIRANCRCLAPPHQNKQTERQYPRAQKTNLELSSRSVRFKRPLWLLSFFEQERRAACRHGNLKKMWICYLSVHGGPF